MGRLAAAELRKHGRETGESCGKIAYIGVTKEDKAVGVSREDGFRSGLKSEGILLEPDYVRTAEFTMDSGYHAALELLDRSRISGSYHARPIRSRRAPSRRSSHTAGSVYRVLWPIQVQGCSTF